MRHFKHPNTQSGQTFLEVVLAVYMIGSLLSAILLLQNTVFFQVTHSVSRMSRMRLLQNYLFDVQLDTVLKKNISARKIIENPPTTIIYKTLQPKDGSSLKNFKNISILVLEATWDEVNRSLKEVLVALRHQPKKVVA